EPEIEAGRAAADTDNAHLDFVSAPLSREHFRQHIAGAGARPRARPGRGAAEIKPWRWRRIARIAGNRPEEEVLIEMVAAGQIVASDQARVLMLEVARRPYRARKDFAPQARRIGFEKVEHTFGVGRLGGGPCGRRNAAERIAGDRRRQNPNLDPQ